jgi:2-keto-3-deoxy-L-rhamnonate aldolase RhmA
LGQLGLNKGGNVKNRTFAKLKAGDPVYGFASGIGSSIATETLGASGIDFVFLDGQHGSFGMDRIIDCLIAAMANHDCCLRWRRRRVRVRSAAESSQNNQR